MIRGRKPKDITGPIPGTMLTAIRRAGKRGAVYLWEFVCECGNTVVRPVASAGTSGRRKARSCGCLNRLSKTDRRKPDRDALVVCRSNAGALLRQISEEFGISPQRVHQILARSRRENGEE